MAKASESGPRKLALTIPRFGTWGVGPKYLLTMCNRAGMMKENKAKLTRATSLMRVFVWFAY